ncbi:hypothetical protein CYY_001188 [Polysphondylium violaceum]|uniref:MICOS complex subunit n=1 Tax=Polysphondylium violaceum TaxID=133409 RepID=A0A8J4VAT4_9MYCE|nr:hypothetical protein CYY_001188 [Polysphondylium violaceum]
MENNNNVEEDGIFRVAARQLIGAKKETDQYLNKINQKEIESVFTDASKAIVSAVDVVSLRDNYNLFQQKMEKVPPVAIVASATILPILLFKKVPSVKDPLLAMIGFGTSMYYCYPEVVSKASKRTLELYKTHVQPLVSPPTEK